MYIYIYDILYRSGRAQFQNHVLMSRHLQASIQTCSMRQIRLYSNIRAPKSICSRFGHFAVCTSIYQSEGVTRACLLAGACGAWRLLARRRRRRSRRRHMLAKVPSFQESPAIRLKSKYGATQHIFQDRISMHSLLA